MIHCVKQVTWHSERVVKNKFGPWKKVSIFCMNYVTLTGLKITAGHQTVVGLFAVLTGQTFTKVWTENFKLQFDWPVVRYVQVSDECVLSVIFSGYVVAFIFSPVSGGDLTTMLVKRGTWAQELGINLLTLTMCWTTSTGMSSPVDYASDHFWGGELGNNFVQDTVSCKPVIYSQFVFNHFSAHLTCTAKPPVTSLYLLDMNNVFSSWEVTAVPQVNVLSNVFTVLAKRQLLLYTPNADMADHSVGARDELHESETSEASVFCFDNTSPEKSFFVDGLVCLISLCLLVFVFLNASRRDRNCPTFSSNWK